MKWKTLLSILAIGSFVLVAPQSSYANDADDALKKCLRISLHMGWFGGGLHAVGCYAAYKIEEAKSEDDDIRKISKPKLSSRVGRSTDWHRTWPQSEAHAVGVHTVQMPGHGVSLRFTPVVRINPPAMTILHADGLLGRGPAMPSPHGPASAGTPASPGTAGRVR